MKMIRENESGVQEEDMFGDKWRDEFKKHLKNGLSDRVGEIIKEDEILRILWILWRKEEVVIEGGFGWREWSELPYGWTFEVSRMLSCFGFKESQKLPTGWNFKARF